MYWKKTRPIISGGLALACFPASVDAAILTSYDFSGASPNAQLPTANVAATVFTPGPGLSIRNDGTGDVSGNPGFSANHARVSAAFVVGRGSEAGTVETSVTNEEYFSFKISATTGYALNLQNFSFSTSYYTLVDSDVIASFFLRSSLDGFANNIGDVIEQEMQDSAVFTSRSITLNDAAFQNVDGEIEFRIYLYDNNNSQARWLAVDNVVVSGEVFAVPEPSSGMLLLFGSSLVFGLRNRRLKSAG